MITIFLAFHDFYELFRGVDGPVMIALIDNEAGENGFHGDGVHRHEHSGDHECPQEYNLSKLLTTTRRKMGSSTFCLMLVTNVISK